MKSEWFQFGAVAVAGIAIVFFLSRSSHGTTPATATDLGSFLQAPNYLTYNQQPQYTAAQTDLPTVSGAVASSPSGSGQPSCGCGSGGNQAFFANNAAFANTMEQNVNGFLTTYENNIMSQFPEYVSQFFNNPQGLAEDAVALTRFASMQGQGSHVVQPLS